MLFINAGAVLSLLATLAPVVLGSVVPEPDGLYKIANVATGKVMDHYRKHPVVGDPVVADTASIKETQNWKIKYVLLGESASYITISGNGTGDEIHVGASEGDGLVTTRKPTVFQLTKVPHVDEPLYWIGLGGDPTLAVTGYDDRSQLTLEKLNATNVLQAWAFYIPVVPTRTADGTKAERA
ncbi:hypothetical protein AURDEDRAFT_175897 [Auricularia subglabra TFB-10046 SS5]|uniref:Ricin B lectin domain-containing protein n=1 Tax=Auricularia subglabra (strain TFB-10046 / SS5) TaxID=717982 RepID=J0LE42_AURST|nr:hypothetical protein AURDEDRAFT_175897 [Auricularia subglabra TFB-10046 SS5]